MNSAVRRGAILSCLPLFLARAAAGQSDSAAPLAAAVRECIDLHERAQEALADVPQWFHARALLKSCMEERCPLALRGDCGRWYEQLARDMPTALILIEGEEARAATVLLEIDGKRQSLPGSSETMELLPGQHHLVFESGNERIERNIALSKGEKNRLVRVRIGAPESVPQPEPPRPTPVETYWLAGAGVVTAALSAVWYSSARLSLSDARSTCAPACYQRADSINLQLSVAQVTGGLGVVLLGVAAYTFWTRPAVTQATGLIRLDLGSDSARLSLGGKF